jgi:hypothetical protein
MGLLLGRRRPDLGDAVSLLNWMVSMTRSATRSLRVEALLFFTLTLAVPGVVGADEYRRFETLVIVYTNTFAGTASFDDVENVQREVDEAVEFIWRSSRMRVHLAVDHLTIYRYVAEDQFVEAKPGRYNLPARWFRASDNAKGSVENDLANLGYQTDSYDIVVAIYAFDEAPGRAPQFGASSWGVNRLLGKAAYVAIPMAWGPKSLNRYFEHEFLHVLHSVFKESGYTGFPLLHNQTFFRFVNGEDASYPKWWLGNFSDTEYFDPTLEWGTVETFKDRDGDGVPDYSPYGDELSITEEALGSSTNHADTDGDGLSDLEEATAGVRGGTDLNRPDTDGDGLADGSDPDPLGEGAPEAE